MDEYAVQTKKEVGEDVPKREAFYGHAKQLEE
jgi:hypothetical protein